MVFLPHRDAAAGEDQVVFGGRLAKGGAGGLEIIGNAKRGTHFAAQAFEQADEGERVGVIDPAGRQGLAGFDEFIAGRQHRYLETAPHRQFGQARRGGKGNLLGPQQGAGRKDFLALLHVLATAADVLPHLRDMPEDHPVCAGFAQFLHHHRIGARRQRGAGKDAGGATGLQGLADTTGGQALRHRQANAGSADVGGPDGIAIHGGVIEGGHGDAGKLRLGEHPAGGGKERLGTDFRHRDGRRK